LDGSIITAFFMVLLLHLNLFLLYLFGIESRQRRARVSYTAHIRAFNVFAFDTQWLAAGQFIPKSIKNIKQRTVHGPRIRISAEKTG
jgi:hypothetical protein